MAGLADPVKMRMLRTKQRTLPRRVHEGFSLLELTVVLVIAGVVFAVAAPNLSRMSESMAYREAVRSLMSAATTAKREALKRGEPMDLLIFPDQATYAISVAGAVPEPPDRTPLDGDVELEVTSAAEVSPGRGIAAVRFYPSGGSSGADIAVSRPSGAATLIQVGWLMADVEQKVLE